MLLDAFRDALVQFSPQNDQALNWPHEECHGDLEGRDRLCMWRIAGLVGTTGSSTSQMTYSYRDAA